ncbi:hypothetical protein HDV05_000468 [Chytridiales sp. JEL 0842]|nr:hypothetical protein HDV05_000468 [Chytridiales sp. JEL 0842]
MTSPEPSSLLSLPYELLTQITTHLTIPEALHILRPLCRLGRQLAQDRLRRAVTGFKLSVIPDIRLTVADMDMYQLNCSIRCERDKSDSVRRRNKPKKSEISHMEEVFKLPEGVLEPGVEYVTFRPKAPKEELLVNDGGMGLPHMAIRKRMALRRFKFSVRESLLDPQMGMVVYNGPKEDGEAEATSLNPLFEIEDPSLWKRGDYVTRPLYIPGSTASSLPPAHITWRVIEIKEPVVITPPLGFPRTSLQNYEFQLVLASVVVPISWMVAAGLGYEAGLVDLDTDDEGNGFGWYGMDSGNEWETETEEDAVDEEFDDELDEVDEEDEQDEFDEVDEMMDEDEFGQEEEFDGYEDIDEGDEVFDDH